MDLDPGDFESGEIGKRNRAYSRVKRSKSACMKSKRRNDRLIRDFSVRRQKLNVGDFVSTDISAILDNGADDKDTRYSPTRNVDKSLEWTYSPLHTPEPSHTVAKDEDPKHSNGHLSSSDHEEDAVTDSNRVNDSSTSVSPEVPVFCSKCNEQIRDLSAVEFEDLLFHVGCFTCARCNATIELNEHEMLVLDGAPLCLVCSPSCWECKKKITESHMRVLDQDFHEDCLKCIRCDKPLKDNLKIYASDKHPCCAACITPVFGRNLPTVRPLNRMMSEYRSFQQHKIHLSPESKQSGSRSPTPRRYRSTTPDVIHMKHMSQSDPTLDISVNFEPQSLPSASNTPPRDSKISCSSLEAVLHDDFGFSLMCNFCTRECSIELVMFWLDVEHFRLFDGDQEDLKLLAQHIVLKYVAYAADMPLCLPRSVENRVMRALETNVTTDMFDEAQKHVYGVMEGTLHRRFLFSEDGLQYLESVVRRDIEKRRQSVRVGELLPLEIAGDKLKAIVTDFDKRHSGSKYYVYRIEVSMPTQTYIIYRRYSEFYTLHQQLKSDHPRRRLPTLPKRIVFGRSQIRAVASQRKVELQKYLKDLLQMPPEVSMCRVLLKFLQQTQSDMEDESFDKRVQRHSVPIF